MTKQVKSKERAVKYGEVFTSKREVDAMLDLVKQEAERIDSRFLEPACGEGAFLKEILQRKLKAVKEKYAANPREYRRNSILALKSIYGIDIMEDNVQICRRALYDIWNDTFTEYAKEQADEKSREEARSILSKNIVAGDALTMLQNDGLPITFTDWNPA